MRVTGLWLPDALRPAGREINVSGIGYAPEGALREGQAAAASGDAALRE